MEAIFTGISRGNPLTAKLYNYNIQSPEIVFRWRDPQFQVSTNY